MFLGSESSSAISVLSCQEGMLGEDNVVRLCPGNERLQRKVYFKQFGTAILLMLDLF